MVDWNADLTDEEAQFVRDHAWNFCVTYQGDGRVPIEPPIDREAPPENLDVATGRSERMSEERAEEEEPDGQVATIAEQVESLTQQGDAAMEAGKYEQAVLFYTAAKEMRDGGIHPSSRSDAVPNASYDSPVRYGRRSGSRNGSVVCVSTPSRRVCKEGRTSRREEVAKRVAARQ